MEKEMKNLLADDQLEKAVGGVGGTGYIDGFVVCGNCNREFIRSDDIIEESISATCPHCHRYFANAFAINASKCNVCGNIIPQEAYEYHTRRLIQCPRCRTKLDGNEITWLTEPYLK